MTKNTPKVCIFQNFKTLFPVQGMVNFFDSFPFDLILVTYYYMYYILHKFFSEQCLEMFKESRLQPFFGISNYVKKNNFEPILDGKY